MSYYYESGYAPRGVYRSRDGMVAGVCAGVAEHFDFSVFWTRVLCVIFMLSTGLFPFVFLYGLAALLMKKGPYLGY